MRPFVWINAFIHVLPYSASRFPWLIWTWSHLPSIHELHPMYFDHYFKLAFEIFSKCLLRCPIRRVAHTCIFRLTKCMVATFLVLKSELMTWHHSGVFLHRLHYPAGVVGGRSACMLLLQAMEMAEPTIELGAAGVACKCAIMEEYVWGTLPRFSSGQWLQQVGSDRWSASSDR